MQKPTICAECVKDAERFGVTVTLTRSFPSLCEDHQWEIREASESYYDDDYLYESVAS